MLPLANLLLLLVNMDGTPRYANQLLDGGRRITWFPASSQRPEDALSRRLQAGEEVVLLCRATSRGCYVCCGRLRLVQWSWEARREWVWELIDWQVARQQEDFAQLMRVYARD